MDTKDMKDIEKMTAEEIDELTEDPGVNPIPVCPDIFMSDDDDQKELEQILNEMGTKNSAETLFRDKVINEICSIMLSESKPNALLIGPAGSGKTQIVEEFARRVKNKSRGIPKQLYGYTVYSVNLSDVVMGSGLIGSLERKVRNLIDYLESEEHKAILFLDEVHVLFQSKGGRDAYKDIAQMLKPALSRGRFKVIAATTSQEVKAINGDPAFNRRFTRVLVDELTKEQTEKVLSSAVKRMEQHYGVKIGFDKSIAGLLIRTADEFCGAGSHRPDNALTLMDRAVASRVIELQAEKKGMQTVNAIMLDNTLVEETAFRIISGNSEMKRFDAPVFRKAVSYVRGQNDIIDNIVRVLELYDLHLRPRNKPLTFLFAGPSGVGKSEIARALSREYIKEKPIILNMAEYQPPSSVNRIIGAPFGYVGSDANHELPFDALDTNPYQLILLDEFEKCDISVQRLFMSVFDEGVMVTNIGKHIDFSKAIIIATTNAGCTERTSNVGFGSDDTPENLSVSELGRYFDIELINRFSHRYTFHRISKPVYSDIVRDCLKNGIAELNMDRLDPKVADKLRQLVNEQTVKRLCDESYDVKLGARPAKTAVDEFIDMVVMSAMSKQPSQGERRSTKKQHLAYNYVTVNS